MPTFWPTEAEQNIFNLLLDVVKAETPSTVLRLAGGIVRDRLLGIESNDIDIAIDNMTGEQFCELISKYLKDRSFDCNKFSVVKANPDQSKHLETAMMKIHGINIDFVNLRKETYTDSRIPVMEFGTPQEDAERRDLTINALFYNINTGDIEDFVGGLVDLELKIAKTPIDPIQTFIDDPLRILRVIRFATKFDLTVKQDIIYACHDPRVREALVNKVTAERKWKEIGGYAQEDGSWKAGFFAMDKAHVALNLIHKMKIADIIFGENTFDFYRVYYNLLDMPYAIKDNKSILVLNLSIIFSDDDNYYTNFENLFIDTLKTPKEIYQRVKLINCEQDFFASHFKIYDLPNDDKTIRDEYVIGVKVPEDYFLRLLLINTKDDWYLTAVLAGKDKFLMHTQEYKLGMKRLQAIVEERGGWKLKAPISGKHLIEIGFPADKSISAALEQVEYALLNNPQLTKEEALELCKSYLPITQSSSSVSST